MPYITREDGERFIIPSYRDILSAKKSSLLKREILLLSANYGEYITLQKKNADQYEIAFSAEPGFLLGECVWSHFGRLFDMVYCEAIPDTTEAILVIVKSGSVYLDGSFPIDTIAEELIVFKSQQNNFSVFIHGNVPISERTEAGKFSFDASSLRSFTVLEAPVFPKLECVKAFQLQQVNAVLIEQGIGVFPVKQLSAVLVLVFLVWMSWTFVTTHKKAIPAVFINAVNPYDAYTEALTSPSPVTTLDEINKKIKLLYTIPGWFPQTLDYAGGDSITVTVASAGARVKTLMNWARTNSIKLEVTPDHFILTLPLHLQNRASPTTINQLQEVIAALIDRLSYIIPGNSLQMTGVTDKRVFKQAGLGISLASFSPATLTMLGDQLKDLPLVITKISVTMGSGSFSGTITFQALGD